MIQRCTNQNNKDYKNYGGRGIKVCERWLKFENFLKDIGIPKNGMTLERINNDGNYELNNCKWATRVEQARNTRHNRLICYNGRIQCLSAWAEEYNISPKILWLRLSKLNWSIEKSLTKPIKRKR